MSKLIVYILLIFNSLNTFSQEVSKNTRPEDLIGSWTIISQRLDNLAIELSDCDKQSTFIFTQTEIIENYYKLYNGNCVILSTNKDYYTVQGNHIIRKEEKDLNNTFVIEGDILTLLFTGKDDDNQEHTAVIVCKKAKPIEYIK